MKKFAVLFALILAAALAGCEQGDDSATADGADTAAADSTEAAAPKQEKAIKVNVGAVRQGDLVQSVFADGVLRTTRTVVVTSKLAGQVERVFVKDGDRVRAGQILLRIDPREYQLTLEESRYRHIQALSQIAAEDEEQIDDPVAMSDFLQARNDLESRRRGMSEEQYAAALLALELDALKKGAFRQDMFAQRTGLADARVAEERAQLSLEYTEIRAPFAGVVSGFSTVVGENLNIGQAICNLWDNSRMEAVVNVLEADLGNLTEGRDVLLAVPAVGDTQHATVDVISPTLDQASRTCEVIVRFDNPDGLFRPGMFVRAEVAASIHHDRLMVPRSSVLLRDDRPLVFKVTPDERAQWLYVDTGLENSDWIEILQVHSGGTLADGDRVVVSDHLTLAHEAKISIRNELPPADRWAVASGE